MGVCVCVTDRQTDRQTDKRQVEFFLQQYNTQCVCAVGTLYNTEEERKGEKRQKEKRLNDVLSGNRRLTVMRSFSRPQRRSAYQVEPYTCASSQLIALVHTKGDGEAQR